MAVDEEDEDDYLSMTFAEPSNGKESSIARTARLKREAAERGRPVSKAERAKREEDARNAALTTRLDDSNKGAKLMAKMGFAGGALGTADNQGRQNPIEVSFKLDRGGIGMDNEKKRKIREQAEAKELEHKRTKLTEQEYRDRTRQEQEDSRTEGQWRGAMKVLEGLEDDADQEPENGSKDRTSAERPLASINLLYRPLVRDRRAAEQRRRDMKSLYEDRQSLRDLIELEPELDTDDKLAFAEDTLDNAEETDEELETYEALPPSEKLDKIVKHLRAVYHYCFWCKYGYEDETMDGCPGLTEDEHG